MSIDLSSWYLPCEINEEVEIIETEDGSLKFPESFWPRSCIRGGVGSEYTIRSDVSYDNRVLSFAGLKYGMHANRYLSIHGWHEAFDDLATSTNEDHPRERVQEAKTRELFLQIGQPAFHPLRLSIGKMELPFAMATTQQSLVNRFVYNYNPTKEAGPHVARLTFDDRISSQIDFAYSTDYAQDAPEDALESYTFRYLYDFDALEGLRLYLSGYKDSRDIYKLSSGFFIRNTRNDIFGFEWVRSQSEFIYKNDFEQFFRLSFARDPLAKLGASFYFDSLRQKYRIVTLGLNYRPWRHNLFYFSQSFYQGWIRNDPKYWYGSLGTAITL